MVDPLRELRTRAELLHRGIQARDMGALRRLRALAELSRGDDAALAAAGQRATRKHCLAVVAREHGFTSWEHAKGVLEGEPGELDFGTMLYESNSRGAQLHVWYATYAEARSHLDEAVRRGTRSYLLPYRKQFFLAEPPSLEAIGLDPYDADWDAIAFDWARPTDRAARARLYGKRIAAMR